MSVRTLSRVWEASQHGGTELLMLLAIADFADDDGRAYPAVAKLAKKCRTTPRHANRLLAALRDSGELEIRLNAGEHGQNRYRIRFDGMLHHAPLTPMSPLTDTSPLTPTSDTPDVDVPKPLTCTSDKPSLNRQEPSGSVDRVADAFASVDLPAKERVWILGPVVMGEKGRSHIGRLVKAHGDEVVAAVLADAYGQLPLADPGAWVAAACVAMAKRKPAGPTAGDAKPIWAIKAGFSNRFEAENAGCYEHNAALFRDGKRIRGGR